VRNGSDVTDDEIQVAAEAESDKAVELFRKVKR